MLIRPDLDSIPFAPSADEYYGDLEKALKAGKIVAARFRYYGSPRPFEPKIDFTVDGGGSNKVITVLYGPKTKHFIDINNIAVSDN